MSATEIVFRVYKKGGMDPRERHQLWDLARQMAEVVDDGITDFDVDAYTDDSKPIVIDASNIDPGWGRR